MEAKTIAVSVEHRPVYGSNEIDELICSCGWRGPAFSIPAHCEEVARKATEVLAEFVALMETDCAGDDWNVLDSLEGRPGFLTPMQFLVAVRNRALNSAANPKG
ncbi:MAG: hypothetical protein WCD38_10495 [Candidatus Tumulicola sp.]